jgi:cytochrome P450
VRPFDDQYHADPHARYAGLHATGAAVHRIRTPDGMPAWLVTGYREVRELFTDPRLSRDLNRPHRLSRLPATGALPLPKQFTTGTVASLDGPHHARLRGYLTRALSANRIRPLRPRIVAVVERLVDALGGSGETDLMEALAVPLSITVIGDLLGVAEHDRDRLRHLLDVIAGLDPAVGYDHAARRMAGSEALEWLGKLIAERRADPRDDVLSEWAHGRDAHGAPLTDHDLIGLAFAFLLGGYDTTVGMVGASFLALLDDPSAYAALREHPELIPDTVEELLRAHGVLHTTRRFAVEDLEVGPARIGAGDVVLLSIAAADRDPRQFGPSSPPRGHLAFGHGPHYCPGAELARTELVVTLECAVRRLPGLRLLVSAAEVPWRPAYVVRVPSAVAVSY